MDSAPQTAGLVEALKKLLKARGTTYRVLARSLELSEASVKRLFSEKTFTLARLEQVCAVLEIDFFDLAKLARGASASVDAMTVAQEHALARDSKLLGVFYLLFNDWRHVLQLEKLGLVDLLPHDKVRLRIPKSVRLRQDGPISRAHGKSVVTTFISADFEQSGGLFRFEVRELSKASTALLVRRLERLAAEFNEIAELDSYLPSGERETIGMALGIRPYVVSWAMGLRVRQGASAPDK